MTVSLDKRLAELDAYLQMLIEQSETLDKKIELANSHSERDGLRLIKSNLDSLLGSIKHAIVLLQIAKVSVSGADSPDPQLYENRNTCYTNNNNNNNSTTGSNKERDTDDDDDTFYDAADEQEEEQRQQQPRTLPVSFDLEENEMDDASQTTSSSSSDTLEQDWDALYEEEEEDLGSLENQGSVIKHLISQIRIGMDLTKVVLPTFILERRSLLEMYADFFAHPDLFSSVPDYETPEERFVQLVRWYLSAFHAGRKSSVAKKPYNPILGEIFLCHWDLNKGSGHGDNNDEKFSKKMQSTSTPKSTNKSTPQIVGDYSKNLNPNSLLFVSEQVSHHPPVSAFYAENREKSIYCYAHIYTKSKYLGLSVGVHNIGQGVIKLLKHNETYVCTFPSAFGRSILTVPWIELGGPVQISCEETGYSANIEFMTKPFYGGKKHRITGELLRPNKEPFLTLDGEWNGCMYSKDSGDKKVFVDTTCLPVIKKQVRPIRSQEPFESRNVWKKVTKALKSHDVTGATKAKSLIEQRQRDQLKDRKEKGIKWKSRYFETTDDGWIYKARLGNKNN